MTIQVSRKGILSFRTPFSSAESPEPFTRLFTGSFDPLIASLWAIYEDGYVSYRLTNNTEILDQLAAMIFDAGIGNYQPTLAVIVTWEEDAPFTITSRIGTASFTLPVCSD